MKRRSNVQFAFLVIDLLNLFAVHKVNFTLIQPTRITGQPLAERTPRGRFAALHHFCQFRWKIFIVINKLSAQIQHDEFWILSLLNDLNFFVFAGLLKT